MLSAFELTGTAWHTVVASHVLVACVTTETRPLGRLGQLGEFEQDSNTDSELESNTDSHSAQSKAHVARQSAAERGEEAPHSKEQIACGVCMATKTGLWRVQGSIPAEGVPIGEERRSKIERLVARYVAQAGK